MMLADVRNRCLDRIASRGVRNWHWRNDAAPETQIPGKPIQREDGVIHCRSGQNTAAKCQERNRRLYQPTASHSLKSITSPIFRRAKRILEDWRDKGARP